MAYLDNSLRLELQKYVEEMTLSGKQSLDEQTMKKLKKICKTADVYVEHAYRLLITQLKKDHSEIRLSAFLIIDELFRRSHVFRELLMDDFHVFLELTIESDYNLPLPPPKYAAKILKTSTQKSIQQWHEKYGGAYKKLSLGFNFLKTCKRVDFNDIRARSLAERSREQEIARRKATALKKKLDKTLKEMEESTTEMLACLTEVENGFNLIVPHPGNFFVKDIETEPVTMPKINLSDCSNSDAECNPTMVVTSSSANTALKTNDHPESVANLSPSYATKDNTDPSVSNQSNPTSDITDPSVPNQSSQHASSDVDSEGEYGSDEEIEDAQLIHQHGLGSRNYNISIEIPKESAGVSVEENEDTADILKMLKDQYQLINKKYLPSLQKWLNILAKSGGSEVDMKKAIDKKNEFETVKQKFITLKVISTNLLSNETDTSEDDNEDFEVVPEKEGYEPHIPSHLRAEYGLETPIDNTKASTSVTKTKNARRTATATVTSKSAIAETVTSKSVDPEKHSSSYWNMTCHTFLDEEKDPTTITANLVKMKEASVCMSLPQASTSKDGSGMKSATDMANLRKKQLLAKAPVIPFGTDLAYWSNPEDIKAPMVEKYESLHRFWVPPEVESERFSHNDIAQLTTRNFEFPGKFEPVKWKCRTLLPNGKLCERMDRHKCPFHGIIIPRNNMGVPDREEDRDKVVKQKPIEYQPESDWQDPELLRDIEAATGINLEIKPKGKKKKGGKGGKKKSDGKYSNLTDIERTKKTSKSRLERKVFNRGSMKRVCAAMDEVAFKRTRDKYANQFNYAFK